MRTVEDAALFLDVCAGSDDRDIQSLPRAERYSPVSRSVEGLRVALSLDLGYYTVSEEIRQNTLRAARLLEEAGALVEPVNLGWSSAINDAWMTYWKVYLAAFYGEHVDTRREDITPELAKWIDEGKDVSAVELRRLELLRTEQWGRLAQVFAEHDAVLCPTTAITAPLALMTDSDFETSSEKGHYRAPDLTLPFNFVSQCPVITVPSGLASDGLPTGVQVVGRRHDDGTVLELATKLEDLGSSLKCRSPNHFEVATRKENNSG